LIRFYKPAHVVMGLFASLAVLNAQNPAAANAPPPPGQAAKPVAPPARRGGLGAGGDYQQYSQETLDDGKRIYTANCAFCHGGNAKGGESGPDLLRSTIVLHDEDGKQIGAFIHVGRPDKGMPKFNLPEDQVTELAAFLHDSVRAAAQRNTYKILDIVVGDPKQGEIYFNAHCASCHSATGDLAHIGSKFDPVTIQQKIVMPREFGRGAGPAANKTAMTVTVTQPSGEVTEGRLVHIDDFSVSLATADGKVKKFERNGDVPKVEVHDPLQPHLDLLPQYTDADIHNLTAYLVTLK
jgi:mono/diheme cytochrome c family protein